MRHIKIDGMCTTASGLYAGLRQTLPPYIRSPPDVQTVFARLFGKTNIPLVLFQVALGAAPRRRLGVWGVVNFLESYGSDNPSSNAHVP